MIRDLILKSRSYRRFHQEVPVGESTLQELVDLARLSPSAANKQPLKYVLSYEAEKNAKIFPHLAWAGYLKDWPGPEEGERPSAYIIILLDTRISKKVDCDHGIAAQSIMLGAVEKGFGGTIISSVKREELSKLLGLPDYLEILLVLAIGKPKEEAVIEESGELGPDGDIKYWRDENQTHHVPKRPLNEVQIRI